MDVYRELGVEPLINAGGTLTTLGGSLMLPEVTDAMAAASRAFVDMSELHLAAGKRIAELVGVEAAHVTSGAAAGIALMAAACMTGADGERIARLPDTTGMRNKFVIQRPHHNPFDQALRLTGASFVDVAADEDELASALRRPDAAGVYSTFAWFCRLPVLPLPRVAELAHAAGLPLIVDAAAEVPPLENLARFVREGADLVAFSGGKAIRGPQSTGFVLGRADLVEACRLNDSPNMAIGRPMKAGKEEIVAVVKAVELYTRKNHATEMAVWERRVAHVIGELAALPHVRAWRQLPFGTGQLIPHAAVSWDEGKVGLTHEEALRRLKEGRPRVAVQLVSPQRYAFSDFTAPELRIHPHTLADGEEMVVARRLVEVLSGKR